MNLIPAPLRGCQRAWLARDVIAGLTLSAVAIPEVTGYTSIAGTPIVTGLYTVIFPTLIFALLGSSRLLVVGADSATAAVVGRMSRSAIGTLVDRASRATCVWCICRTGIEPSSRGWRSRRCSTTCPTLRGGRCPGTRARRWRTTTRSPGTSPMACSSLDRPALGCAAPTRTQMDCCASTFPRGTDLNAHGPEVLRAVEDRLNHRPRKILGWRTPAEVSMPVCHHDLVSVATIARIRPAKGG
jgi:hypothetical protein